MAEEIKMCDVVNGERAIAQYIWAWGEEGFCSVKGQFLLNQKAGNLKRTIQFIPLANLPPAPMMSDERTRLIAERLSAQSELAEVNERNSRLFASNTELASQVREFRIRDEAAVAEIGNLNSELAEVKAAHSKLSLDRQEIAEQLGRANVLLEASPKADEEIASLRVQLENSRNAVLELNAQLEAATKQ
jgi:hypothetical protein